MTFQISAELAAAHAAASIAFADTGSLPSRIRFYTGLDGTGTLLAEAALQKPCATLVDGALVLHPADVAGTMILQTGVPRSARWISGAGVLLAIGTVTDLAHDGDIKIVGSGTAVGDDSPMLYAGGLFALGTLTLS